MGTKVSDFSINGSDDKYTLSPFEEAVLDALKCYGEPEKLGIESPLATSYFLSQQLSNHSFVSSTQQRGEALRVVIRQSAASLWGAPLPRTYDEMKSALYEERKQRGSLRYSYLILELRYFRQFFHPRSLREIYESDEYLLDSKAGDHRAHKFAIRHLAEALLARLHPATRPEQPLSPPPLVGYEVQLEQCQNALAKGGTVCVTGPSGAGKTSLGATIIQRMSPRSTFWFTLRPTLNDRLGCLLYALGHYFQAQGATNLWQYLVAANGNLQDHHIALALVRQDLHQLIDSRPILCFDEMDRLHTLDPEQTNPYYTQLLEFMEGLRGSASILIIGQRSIMDADQTIRLTGLRIEQLQQLCSSTGISLSADELTELFRYTSGNPRMILLILALHQTGEPFSTTFASIAQSSGMLPILRRLWSRLEASERQLLQRLAVFRSFAPEQMWEGRLVERMITLRLIERNDQGGIALIPGLRENLYTELSAELRQQLHVAAAEMRAQLGEYTTAAYHYWQGGATVQAIQLWYPHRKGEITRGQTDAALMIFTSISGQELQKPERNALDLLRAELRLLRGELTQGLAEIEQVTWWDQGTMSARLYSLRGEFYDSLGYPDAALTSYTNGMKITFNLLNELTNLQMSKSRVHLARSEMQAAWREARLAECQTQLLIGRLEESEGRYSDAQLTLQQALTIANHLQDDPSLASIHRVLATIYGRLGNCEKAIQHTQIAIEIFERLGNRLDSERVRSNLALIYLDNRYFREALEPAHKAWLFFKAIEEPHTASTAAANLAEAYFELGDWQHAEHFAQEVLAMEEPHSYPYGMFTLGRLRQAQQNWDSAITHFTAVIQQAKRNEDKLMVAHGQRELGRVYREVGRHADARNELQAACQLFEQMGITAEVLKTNTDLEESKLQ